MFVKISACHSKVDVNGAYQDCLYDLCHCTLNEHDCMCPTLGSYADQCAAAGVQIPWRLNITECGQWNFGVLILLKMLFGYREHA